MKKEIPRKVSRQEAIKLESKRYYGKPCINCDQKQKYTSDARCVGCKNKSRDKWRELNFGKEKESRWRKENPESVRSSRLKARFGITLNDYNQILKLQNYGCAICGIRKDRTIDPRSGKRRMLAVDHDHKTGKVRGLLCDLHNRGLGMFQDDVNFLKAAIKYLKKHGVCNDKTIRRYSKKNRQRGKEAVKSRSNRI